MKKYKGIKYISVTIAGTIITTTIAGCGKNGMPVMSMDESSNELLVEVQEPEYGTMSLTGEFVATISPNQSVKILAKTSGEVKSVSVSTGDVVEEGTELCKLDDTDALRTLASAQLSYDSALSNYDYDYGDAADTINSIDTNSTYQTATDSVQDNQQKLVDLRSNLADVQSDLNEELDNLKQLHSDYDYEDIEELEDTKDYYYEKYQYYKEKNGDNDEKTQEYLEKYTSSYSRYSLVDSEDTEIQDKIDSYQDQIDDLQSQIDSYSKKVYESYSDFEDTITKQELQNGTLRGDQENVSNNSVKSAQLNVESAQDAVDNCTITSPVSGIVDSVNVEEYDMVNSGTTTFIITSQESMKATFYVSDAIRNSFELGQDVTLSANDQEYKGTITEIPNSVDDSTGLFEIEATVNADGDELLSGTTAKLKTRTYHEDNTLIVPGDVINYQDSKGYVYCYSDGVAVKTYIETGLSDDTYTEITEGLLPDSQIITSWSAQLRDGVTVKIKDDSQTTEETTDNTIENTEVNTPATEETLPETQPQSQEE